MSERVHWKSLLAGTLILAVVCLLLNAVPAASAASSGEIKKQIQQLQQEQEKLQNQINELEALQQSNVSELEQIIAEKNNLDQQVGILYRQVEIIDQQIASYNVLIADKQEELEEAEARQAALIAQNKERIRAMEEDGNLSYWSVLFNASSFSDFLDQISMVEEIAAADQRRLQELSKAAEAVSQVKEALAAEQAELELTKGELADTWADLDAKQAEANDLLEQLLAKGQELDGLLEELHSQEQEVIDHLAEKEDELSEAKKKEYQQWLSTSVPDPEPGQEVSDSGWIKPCTYRRVSSPYGYRDAPTEGASTFHTGIDLAGPKGTKIYAAKSGTVTAAYYDEKGGWTVKIDHHDGFASAYLHMTSFVVKKGDIVSQGQLIGYMGSTGTASTGSHLHFSIYYNGKTVNPADYIDF